MKMFDLPSGAGTVDLGHIIANEHGAFSTFGAGAPLATALLQSNFKVQALRPLNSLRKDEWIALDAALLSVARARLRVVQDIMSRGLVYNLANAMGKTRLEWERVSDMTPAEINMSGLTETENDRVDFDLVGMPIPIISKDFHINIRALAASRERGEALDTIQVERAGRVVAEKIEALTVNGGFTAGANGTIYGLTNHPNRNTGSLDSGDWVTSTGANILADVLEMIGLAHGDHMYGPYSIYVPAAADIHLDDDFKAESDRTIRERLSAISSVAAIMPSDDLASSNVVMVQMTKDVLDMVNGIQPTVVQWDTKGGMQFNFKVIAILLPRIKADQANQSGIVHYSN